MYHSRRSLTLAVSVLALAAVACTGDVPTLTAPASPSAAVTLENPIIRAVAIAGAFNTSCAILTTGPTVCWGWNYSGQLGDGTTTNRNIAVPVATSLRFARIAVGSTHVCALTLEGVAWCWGGNFWGSLGNGTSRNSSLVPVRVSGGLRFSDIVAGQDHTCGLTKTQEVYCWGFLLNTTTLIDASVPIKVSDTHAFKALVTGGLLPCGIGTDDVTYCFDGVPVPALNNLPMWRPAPVPNAPKFVSLSGGEWSMCGLTAAGVAYCWGDDSGGYGFLGNPAAGLLPTVPVSGNLTFTSIYSAYDWTCGITTAGQNYCWGHNSIDTFGPNLPNVNPTPVLAPFPAGMAFTARASGWQHTCGITTTTAVQCWGVGSVGQLADGLGTLNDPTPHIRGTPGYARRIPM
jgi:alpha-tubulin suppressor-like RCC1 family protein